MERRGRYLAEVGERDYARREPGPCLHLAPENFDGRENGVSLVVCRDPVGREGRAALEAGDPFLALRDRPPVFHDAALVVLDELFVYRP